MCIRDSRCTSYCPAGGKEGQTGTAAACSRTEDVYKRQVPLRLVTFSGFAGAVLSVLVSLAYLIYKLIFWSRFSVGVAPLVIGMFFFMSIQMLFMGIVGEYIGTIHTLVQKRPLVVEQERINFEYGPGEPLGENETRGSVTP